MKKLRICILAALAALALVLFAACSSADGLPKPKDLVVQNKTLSWSAVENARGYAVNVKGETYTTRRTSFSLEPLGLTEGKYTLRVKALGNDINYSDSEWASITYNQGYESGLTYTLINGDREYAVASVGTATGDIVIDDTYNGLPVTAINNLAFSNSLTVKTVKFGKNIHSVGQRAFYGCTEMTAVELSESLVVIDEMAFQSCRGLAEITIPDSVEYIGHNAFAFCRGMEELTLGDGLVYMDEGAFDTCESLKQVVLPAGLKILGSGAFRDCKKLESVGFDCAELVQVDEFVFRSCTALKTIDFKNCKTEISKSMFRGCTALTKVVIPNTVTAVRERAFADCSALSDITIGSGVTAVGVDAFDATAAWNNTEDKIVVIDGWAVGCKSDDIAAADITALGAKNIVGIAAYAFYEHGEIVILTVPQSVVYINEYAFAKCTGLFSASIAGNTSIIGTRAFDGCTSLMAVNMGSSRVETIGSYAFNGCERLAANSVVLPSTVTRIGTYAFYNTALWQNTVGNDDAPALAYAGNWVVGCNTKVGGEVPVRDGTIGIADYAFARCESIENITLPDTVRYIGGGAFYECKGMYSGILTLEPKFSVNIPYGIKTIEPYTFQGAGLNSVNIPNTVTSIGYAAFASCSRLTAVDISDSVTEIGDYAFWNCKSLEQVKLSKNITTIGMRMFSTCEKLTSIDIPDNVATIGEGAFFDCAALETVNFGANSRLEVLGEKAFYRCAALKTIALPDDLTEIGASAFFKCEGLTDIDLGLRTETIGDFAFYGCTGLTSIVITDSVTTIGDRAFMFCENLTSAVIGRNVTSISDHAFYGDKVATFYFEVQRAQSGWGKLWNSLYRPVVYGCTLDEQREYVISTTRDEKSIYNHNAQFGIAPPVRDGYEFLGWALENGGEVKFTANELYKAENGATLYAVWKEAKQ